MSTKVTIYLDDELYEKTRALYKIKNFKSISSFIQTAMEERFARDAGQEASQYMSKQLVSMVESTIRLSEQRINRMLFKLAVGDAELKRVIAIASRFKNKIHLMDEIHEQSLREVRVTNGILNLKNTLEHTSDDDIERYAE